jgi:hypothetical protein
VPTVAGHVVEEDVAALDWLFTSGMSGPAKRKPVAPASPIRIASDLLLHKLIERHVLVQRLDDPVPILPGAAPLGIVLKTIRLREAGEIQPPLRPVFAVAWDWPEAIHEQLHNLSIRRLTIGGGSPVRSKVTRRMSVAASASETSMGAFPDWHPRSRFHLRERLEGPVLTVLRGDRRLVLHRIIRGTNATA